MGEPGAPLMPYRTAALERALSLSNQTRLNQIKLNRTDENPAIKERKRSVVVALVLVLVLVVAAVAIVVARPT